MVTKKKFFIYFILLILLFYFTTIQSYSENTAIHYIFLKQWKLKEKNALGHNKGPGYLVVKTIKSSKIFPLTEIYVSVGSYIKKFSTYDDTFTTIGKGPGVCDGCFVNAKGISLDKEGNIYTTDFVYGSKNRIQKFSSGGEFMEKWIVESCGLDGICLDSEENFYVTDCSSTIFIFSKEGKVYQTWGFYDGKGPGSKAGEFNLPRGIAIDSKGFVYIVDSANHRIQKFKKDGGFVLQFGSKGKKFGQFNNPCGIGIDIFDNVYIVDTGNNRIQIFTEDGKFITSFGKKGEGPGEFNNPCGIAIDRDGFIYVADSDNFRVQMFRPKKACKEGK
jgi:DNA-binding beta-propeller fold protein YncE